jgi:2'-hydroxyisoflavone reductase
MPTRRRFLELTSALGLLAATGCARRSTPTTTPDPQPPVKPQRLLVLGGTGFIGPHLVRHAVARGHHVTIFTRGKREAELPAGVVRLIGDRNGKLEALAGQRWDLVVDDSATNPDYVRQSTELLKDSVGRYLFTSSTGVYYPYLEPGADESRPVRMTAQDPEDGAEAYGVAKAQCERHVLDTFKSGDRGVVVRPTYIVGPGDTTDRFPYWPQRLRRGGEVLAPGRRSDPAQLVDVRDLAEFMLRLLEDGRSGIYNVAGPAEPLTISQFLEVAVATINPDVRLTWIDDYDFLEAHEIFDSIPWVLQRGNNEHCMEIRIDRSVAAGLKFRPLATTLRDTLAWWPSVPEARRASPGFSLKPEQEARALADWHARPRPGAATARRAPPSTLQPA